MHVNYTKAGTFSNKKSLILQGKKWPKTNFSLSEKDNRIVISTKKMKAAVNTETSQVSFYDSNGKLLLKEKKGGKTITPINYEGVQTNEVKDEFQSYPGVAIYGMGQQQDRLLNIKGYDLDLFQHNTEVFIPFFVSTNGYGLLWHNYSNTKFGNPDAIQSIPSEQLYNEEGKQGSLTARLYADKEFKKVIESETSHIGTTLNGREDTLINAIKLTGFFKVKNSGDPLFYSYADGTFKLYINNKLIIIRETSVKCVTLLNSYKVPPFTNPYFHFAKSNFEQ